MLLWILKDFNEDCFKPWDTIKLENLLIMINAFRPHNSHLSIYLFILFLFLFVFVRNLPTAINIYLG